MTTTKRQCFWVPVDQFDAQGWIPSLVTEGEPGHAPLTGRGTAASAWHWGDTYEEAKAQAAEENAKLGLTPGDCAQIVASSMAAS